MLLRKTVLAFGFTLLTAFSASACDLELTGDVKDAIREKLVGYGYEVGKIKIEDCLYEAYAKKDGDKLEIFMNTELEVEHIVRGQKLELTDEIKAQIKGILEAEGYSVGKIKIEDGLYEAYAKKDGKKLEIFMDTGMNIVRIEED